MAAANTTITDREVPMSTNTVTSTDIDAWLAQGRMAAGAAMTDERLSEVFDMVKPADNWKLPIDALVSMDRATVDEIMTAVAWFAGGHPTVTTAGVGVFRVTGAGYYTWIGA